MATRLIPLFLDQGQEIKQLIAILSPKGLPAVVNNPQREAYMGRGAFDLPNWLTFMSNDTQMEIGRMTQIGRWDIQRLIENAPVST